MKRTTLLKTMLLLCALVAGSGSVWADTVLFHETFGDNSGSARAWDNNYGGKTGVPSVYSEAAYIVTNAKQCKNTMGQTASALVSNQGATGTFIVGPLSVSDYSSLTVTNYFGMSAGSWAEGSFMKLSYSTDNNTYTEVSRTGSNPSKAVSKNSNLVQASYTLPAAASSRTLYLKFEFYCKQINSKSEEIGQLYFDELELKYTGDPVPSTPAIEVVGIPVCTMSISTCNYSDKTWTHIDNSDYTLSDGATDISTKDYSGTSRIKLVYGKTYTLTVPSDVAVTKVYVTGASANAAGSQITIDGVEKTIGQTVGTDVFFIGTPTAGASISIGIAGKEFGLESVVLYTADGITLSTTDNMAGWRTFYDATQDYEVDANTRIYVAAASGTANQVTLTEVAATKIPHGEAVILKTSAVDHKMVLTKTTGAATLGANVLTVTDGTNNVDGYRLGYKADPGVAFFKYTTTTAPAAGIVYIDKANVNTGAGAPEFLGFDFGSETTAILSVNAEKANAAPRKMLKDGRIVIETAEGTFLMNGSRVK